MANNEEDPKASPPKPGSTNFVLLKDWLRGSLRQITKNGDLWIGKRAVVFVEPNHIKIRDKSNRSETIFLYDETEALGILRALETGQKVLEDLPRVEIDDSSSNAGY